MAASAAATKPEVDGDQEKDIPTAGKDRGGPVWWYPRRRWCIIRAHEGADKGREWKAVAGVARRSLCDRQRSSLKAATAYRSHLTGIEIFSYIGLYLTIGNPVSTSQVANYDFLYQPSMHKMETIPNLFPFCTDQSVLR